MLIDDSIFQKIEDTIDRSYTGFIYQVLGEEFLDEDQKLQLEALGLLASRKSLLELLYLLVKQRSEERYQTQRNLNELLEDILEDNIFINLPRTHQATINNASRSIESIIDSAKSEAKKRIKKEITQANKEYTAIIEEGPEGFAIQDLPNRQEKNITALIAGVGVALLAVNKLFHRDFTSELTDLVNKAAVDAAKDKESLAYKVVVNDQHLCDYCHKSYVNPDGSPKIYKIKDLLKNGSNEGKPKFQWKPVVGPHHIRCRCQLVLLPEKLKKDT